MGIVLVIALSDLGSDPRVDRQIDFLRGVHRVTAAGFGPSRYEDVRHVALERRRGPVDTLSSMLATVMRLVGLHERSFWIHPDHRRWRRQLASEDADSLIVNDATLLPLAFSVAEGRPVVFDAHEYAPVEFERSWRWRLSAQRHVRWICRDYVPRTAGMMTVGRRIAARYEEDSGIRAAVVTNAPRYEELEPTPVGDPVRLVHFGWADPQRRLEDTIEAVSLLGEGYSLDLVLITPEALEDETRKLRDRAGANPRVRFLDPVPMRELVHLANGYDIGVHMLPPATFNQRFALPNKFFEYIQARIAPAIGPSPEMARIVHQWDCGIVSDDYTPQALAAAIAATTRERLAKLKRNAGRAARELCAERNREIVIDVVNRALRSGGLDSAVAPAPGGHTSAA
jgi:glycosyltransferase involved in cell wall biosynthesis